MAGTKEPEGEPCGDHPERCGLGWEEAKIQCPQGSSEKEVPKCHIKGKGFRLGEARWQV